MSTQVFPALPGLGFPWKRETIWKTRRQMSVSGKETRIADWSVPLYKWTLQHNFLRQGAFNGSNWTEFSQLFGFFDQMKGGWDSFLYKDPDDNTVTNQALGNTDGVNQIFQLYRTFGGATMPVLAPDSVATHSFTRNGTSITPTINTWGSSQPGTINLGSVPSSGQALVGTFSYYFPVRFDDDTMSFDKFMGALYEQKQVSFTSIK